MTQGIRQSMKLPWLSNFIYIIHIAPNFIVIGYRGWGCTDDREATSEIDLLAATLLLCLSNLLFLPAVGLAIYRGFYTESFVYFANMVFSTVSCDKTRSIFNHIQRLLMLLRSFHLYYNLYSYSSTTHVIKTYFPSAWWNIRCFSFVTYTLLPWRIGSLFWRWVHCLSKQGTKFSCKSN